MPDSPAAKPGGNAAPSPANGIDPWAGARLAFVAGAPEMYASSPEQSPADRFRTAIRVLAGGAGRRAAGLIAQAVEEGLTGDPVTPRNKIAYYWILAILSGHAFELEHQKDAIDRARVVADLASADEFREPWKVLSGIASNLLGQSGIAASPLGNDYHSLPSGFQEEIYRHIGMMLTGRIAEAIEADLVDEVRSSRMGAGRASRAWKYFEQDPAAPQLKTFEDAVFPVNGRVLAVGGVILCLIAVPLAIGALQESGVVRALILSVLIAAAGVITVRSRIAQLAAIERIADKDAEFGEFNTSRYSRSAPPSPAGGLPFVPKNDAEAEQARQNRVRLARFSRHTSAHLDEQFAERTPRDPAKRTRWIKQTTALRESIKTEILRLYGESPVAPGQLNWLMNWRARETRRLFDKGELRAYQERMRPRTRYVLGVALGVVVTVVALGYALLLVLVQRPVQGAIAMVLLAGAVVAFALSRVDVYLVDRRRLPDDRRDAREQFDADQAERARWVAECADPPDDLQIANWLDLDKIHLKRLAMKQLKVAGPDILGYVSLTEPAPDCIGRRMPYGPPRYSAYRVTVFLLTNTGVRQVVMKLDFLTGLASDHVRRSFQYDTIMSARMQEHGIHYDSQSRLPSSTPAKPWSHGRAGAQAIVSQEGVRRNVDGSIILRQDFRIAISDGEGLRFLVENFESGEWPEDPVYLLDLALDTSGVSAALDLLQVVAGHGAGWALAQ